MKIIYINIIALKSVKSFKNKCLDNYLKSQERERVSKKTSSFFKNDVLCTNCNFKWMYTTI